MIISNIMPINRNIECNICENDNCFIKLCEPDYFLLKNVGKHTMSYKKGQYIIREGESVSGIYSINTVSEKIAAAGHDTQFNKASEEVYSALPGCCQYERVERN